MLPTANSATAAIDCAASPAADGTTDRTAQEAAHDAAATGNAGGAVPWQRRTSLILRSGRTLIAWTALVGFCYLVSELAESIGVPAPDLLAGLLVGLAVALSGLTSATMPRPMTRASQALVGVVMGSYLTPEELGVVAPLAAPFLLATLATVALALGVAHAMARWSPTSRSDATLATIPGGSAAIVSCADDLGSDARFVGFAQYLRVGLVALTAPAVAWVASGPLTGDDDSPVTFGWPDLEHLLTRPVNQIGAGVALAGVCLAGAVLGRRLGLPAPLLLGPMVIAGVFSMTHASEGFTPDGPFKDMVFVIVGLEVGLRFTWSAVRGSIRVLPQLLVGIVALALGCAGLAWALAALVNVPFLDAYLATTPGGINAVLATAESTRSDVPLVSTVQSLRLFAVVLAMPPIVRALEKVQSPQ